MKMSLTTISLAAVLALAPAASIAAPLQVVASFSIIGDLARNVGGDHIDLTTLIGPNGDAHVFEPTPADAIAMSKADVILVNGLHLEGFLDRLVEVSGSNGEVVEVSHGITPIPGNEDEAHADEDDGEDEHDHGALDPHAWQSVPNAEIYVENITVAFCNADPQGCPDYKANALAYLNRLKSLDADVRDLIGKIPGDKRTIITSHDAFGYFGHEYGLTLLAPQGASTEAEPSAAGVAALIGQIREEKASALFVENVNDPRVIEQIGRETGIAVGGELFSDALSPADGPAATYLDMIRHNAETITAAMLGD
jgi:zinc/manganese transport system substrate-binding protein